MTGLSDLRHIAVTVDGIDRQVPAEMTILQALSGEGIHVPSLCNDIRL